MTSQLNVDTIVDKAGSGGSNVKMANTSTYVSDGGNVSQNTVQGLAKAYLTYDQTVPEIDGSFNVASVTDNAAGNWNVNYTNNMNNTTYSWFIGGQDARFAGVNTGTIPTTSTIRYYTRITTTAALIDVNLNTAGIHGDLA